VSRREHLILCGRGTRPGRLLAPWRTARRIELDTTPATGNVQLRIGDITERMVANLPPVVEDLAELAAYVYAADQASERGAVDQFDYGTAWRRRFRL
jgi:hypothetical protein